MNKIALYAGTFDPITFGHLDIIRRSLNIVDTLIVAIAQNKNKNTLLDLDERTNLIKQLVKCHPKVSVMSFDNLLVDFAKSLNASILIRGIRNSTDFNYEYQLANTNRDLAPHLETIFLFPSSNFCHLSSTFVREINQMGGDVSAFVPESVNDALTKKSSSLVKD